MLILVILIAQCGNFTLFANIFLDFNGSFEVKSIFWYEEAV
jgi:hypothetical protein